MKEKAKRKKKKDKMADVDSLRQELLLLTGQLNAAEVERQQEIASLRAELNNARDMAALAGHNATMDTFRIPDPIKLLPNFEGNKKTLQHWINAAEKALSLYATATPQQKQVYFQAVVNKLEGKARDCICLAGEINSFVQLKKVLTDQLGDRQEISTYKSQLWHNKMGDSVHTYYKKCAENMLRIKSLAKLNPVYAGSWEAINSFIEEDGLAAFVSGLKRPYFGYCQSAKPTNMEEAYAFLCKFESNDRIYRNTYLPQSEDNGKKFQKKESFKQTENQTFKPSEKQSFKNFKTQQEPMEVDPSVRAKTNYTRKSINNHEIDENENANDNDEEEIEEISEDEFEVNFCTDTNVPTTT